MNTAETADRNPLATEKIPKLVLKYAIPMIISQLVSSLYNIVDQIFIGHSVGIIGNSATTVCLPIVNVCAAIALLFGVGGASNFSIKMGQDRKEEAAHFAGNAMFFLTVCGTVFSVLVSIFLKPVIIFLGATAKNLTYALTYARIVSFGIPFLIISTGGSVIIRADRSPKYSMASTLTGAIINCILDPIFIFVFNMGIAGAAYATVIGQVVSAIMVLRYFPRYRSVKLERHNFKPKTEYLKAIVSLGMSAGIGQVAMTIVTVLLNNSLRYYGGLSAYGSDIPIACVGVLTKVNIISFAFAIGIAQGCQPINGFNFGAEKYDRVRQTFMTALIAVTTISTVIYILIQAFPLQVIKIFGNGSEEYYRFAIKYLRTYMVLAFANGIQPLVSNFFTSIGKAKKGVWISLTRQVLFYIPLLLILPRFLGVDGILYTGPISDFAAVTFALILAFKELKHLKELGKSIA